MASAGDKALGGHDVDELLVRLITERFRREHHFKITLESHAADLFSIREEVIRQKHLLAARTEVQIAARVDGKQVLVKVTREEFTQLLTPLMERVEQTIQRAIAVPSELGHRRCG